MIGAGLLMDGALSPTNFNLGVEGLTAPNIGSIGSTPAVGGTTPPASSGMSAMQGAAIGSGISGATSAVCGAIGGIFQWAVGQDIIDIKKAAAKSAYAHQAGMAKKHMEGQIAQIEGQEQMMRDVAASQEKAMETKEERAKAEGEEMLANVRLKEAKTTEKAGKIKESTLNAFFDGRGRYTNLGTPKVKV